MNSYIILGGRNMNQKNICNFVPRRDLADNIRCMHFVKETKIRKFTALQTESVYKVYLVTKGAGRYHTVECIRSLVPGDIFFSFPSQAFAIESEKEFEYMYISFLGTRAAHIMNQLKISQSNCYFHGVPHIADIWERSILIGEQFSDLASESALLYTFAQLGKTLLRQDDLHEEKRNPCSATKKYLEKHFHNTDFSMNKMSAALSYNPKYLSTVFKKTMGIGIIEYLNIIRIQHACTMISQGFTSVSDIATSCGFSDPQYFSRIFKAQLDISPREYIAQKNRQR